MQQVLFLECVYGDEAALWYTAEQGRYNNNWAEYTY